VNCERVVALLTGPIDDASAAERRIAAGHAATCPECRDAVTAVHALRLSSLAPLPTAPPGAVDRALSMSAGMHSPLRNGDSRFWLGMGVGAALAAGVVLAILVLAPFEGGVVPEATPQLEMALNEVRDINISLDTKEALVDAEIHVTLRGAVGLSGYPGQRQLQWHTNLDAGPNQLTLPIVAVGTEGGQVMVEVVHGGKRRTFLVDVQARV
jgi:hypothetical protein